MLFVDQHRRRFLQLSLATGLQSLKPSKACSAESQIRPRARACILLYMDGGPSHIDSFDMKLNAPAEVRGPFRAISSSVAGTQVCEHLPHLAQQMHRLLQIRSVRHEETVHDPAVYQMLTGYKHISSAGGLQVEETDLPHMGSAFAQADRTPATMPKFLHTPDWMRMDRRVLPGQNAGILPASFAPFQVTVTRDGEVVKPDFGFQFAESVERQAARLRLYEQLATTRGNTLASVETERLKIFRQQAAAISQSAAVRQAFDLETEPASLRAHYGLHRHGQSVLLARRLVEAGARFVTVYWGNEEQDWADGQKARIANNPWDTHRNHFPLVKDSLFPRADQTLAALLQDLSNRGLLDDTLVVWMGDFGRTPRISQPWASRDHWPFAFTVLMSGAGVRGGAVIGRTDSIGGDVTERPVTPADLTATIFHSLGVSPATRLPTRTGATHRLSTGSVLQDVFA